VHTYDAAGDYEVTLTVTDDEGATGSETRTVSVGTPLNLPPVADFSADATDLSVTFTDLSSDPDGSVISWYWRFGDGGVSFSRSPVHVYQEGGTYSVTLSVVDNQGASDSEVKSVTVTAPGPTIELTGKRRGRNRVILDWTPVGVNVDVWRTLVGGSPTRIASGVDGGHYEDSDLGAKPTGLYTYLVCETGNPDNCSNEVDISF
jgi:PKD repeat protein